jgi:hypothetical protein
VPACCGIGRPGRVAVRGVRAASHRLRVDDEHGRPRWFEGVSAEAPGDERTGFEVGTDGKEYRFFLWITDLDSLGHVSEARAG